MLLTQNNIAVNFSMPKTLASAVNKGIGVNFESKPACRKEFCHTMLIPYYYCICKLLII